MKERLVTLFCFLICTLTLLSQRNLKALDIGDLVPNLKSNSVLFHESSFIELKQFQGKLIILDFFSTGCMSCVQKLPRYMSLQQQFKNEIQIILVTPEDSKMISSFWGNNDKRHWLKGIRLPVVTGDTEWVKYFPHEEIPHEIWLGANLRIMAFTGAGYVTEEYVREALYAEVLNWQMKRDYSYDISQPTLTYNREQPEAIKPSQMFYNCLWRTTELAQSGIFRVKDSINKTYKLSVFNSIPLVLYKWAIGWGIRTDIANRITWETKRREEIDPSAGKLSDPEWQRKYNLSFEAVFPISASANTKNAALLNSLNTYFGINGRLETRITDCWLLIARPGYFHRKLTQKEAQIVIDTQGTIDSFRVVKPVFFVYEMNKTPGWFPVIDSTHMDSYISIETFAKNDYVDFEKVKEHLWRNGFDLVRSRQPVEMLVLSDEEAK